MCIDHVMVRHGPLRVQQPEWPSKKRCKGGQEGMQGEGQRRKARRGEMGPKPHGKGGNLSLKRRGVVSGEDSKRSVGCHEGGEPAGACMGAVRCRNPHAILTCHWWPSLGNYMWGRKTNQKEPSRVATRPACGIRRPEGEGRMRAMLQRSH